MINMHAFVQMSPARDTLWTDWSRSRRGRSESSNYDYPYDIYVSSDKSHWQLVHSFYLSALFLSRDTLNNVIIHHNRLSECPSRIRQYLTRPQIVVSNLVRDDDKRKKKPLIRTYINSKEKK